MQQLENRNVTSKKVRSVVSIAAALLGAAVLCQPDLAHARGGHGGGGIVAASTAAVSMVADFTVTSLPCTTMSLMSTRITKPGL